VARLNGLMRTWCLRQLLAVFAVQQSRVEIWGLLCFEEP